MTSPKIPYQLESQAENAPPSLKSDLSALDGCPGNGCKEAEGP